MVASLDQVVPQQEGIQEAAGTKGCFARHSTQSPQIPSTSQLAMVQTVHQGQAFAQHGPRRGRDEGVGRQTEEGLRKLRERGEA
ncbi:UNVERIFIED_CONTAM: hypothetical protein NCL1_15806 [Trichonephila clavipes]